MKERGYCWCVREALVLGFRKGLVTPQDVAAVAWATVTLSPHLCRSFNESQEPWLFEWNCWQPPPPMFGPDAYQCVFCGTWGDESTLDPVSGDGWGCFACVDGYQRGER
jgi:hypothetical protein